MGTETTEDGIQTPDGLAPAVAVTRTTPTLEELVLSAGEGNRDSAMHLAQALLDSRLGPGPDVDHTCRPTEVAILVTLTHDEAVDALAGAALAKLSHHPAADLEVDPEWVAPGLPGTVTVRLVGSL